MPGEKNMKPEPKKKSPGFALPLLLIVVLGVGSFFIQIVFNKTKKKDECDYSIAFFPAELIHADTVKAGYCDFLFRVQKDEGADTVSYSSEFGGYASFEQINKNHLVLGETFQYAVKKLKKGDCPPLVEGLLLIKY